MRNIVYLLTLLIVSLTKNGPHYEVISCPGSMENYKMLTSILNQSGANETTLDRKLKAWYAKSGLNKRIKVVVTFKSSDGKIWKWCMNKSNKTSDFFESTLTPAASRDTGILPKIGDQQRCFFTDTTLIIDNFVIPAGSFSRDDLITLTIDNKRYFLLFNESKHEYYIPSAILERIPKSQYLDTRAKLNNEAFHFKLYLFSKEEYNDLTYTLTNTSKSINCNKLPNYITDYLFDNWGKKSCTNSTAYANRLKIEIKKIITESDIKCDHE